MPDGGNILVRREDTSARRRDGEARLRTAKIVRNGTGKSRKVDEVKSCRVVPIIQRVN